MVVTTLQPAISNRTNAASPKIGIVEEVRFERIAADAALVMNLAQAFR
jgi:hypothetical protein